MDIHAEKLDLLQTIMNTNDESLILDVKGLITERKSGLVGGTKQRVTKGCPTKLAEADRSKTVSHAEVVKLFGKWGLK